MCVLAMALASAGVSRFGRARWTGVDEKHERLTTRFTALRAADENGEVRGQKQQQHGRYSWL